MNTMNEHYEQYEYSCSKPLFWGFPGGPAIVRNKSVRWAQDARAHLTDLFLTIAMKGMYSGPSQCGWVGLKRQIHSNLLISLSFWIISSLNLSRSSISNTFILGHPVLHVSAN